MGKGKDIFKFIELGNMYPMVGSGIGLESVVFQSLSWTRILPY